MVLGVVVVRCRALIKIIPLYLALLGVFITTSGSFLINNGFTTKVYLSGVLAALIFLGKDIFVGREFVKLLVRSKLALLLLAFLVWFSISSLWSGNIEATAVGRSVVVVLYVISIAYVCFYKPVWLEMVLFFSVCVAAVMLLYSSYSFYGNHSLSARYTGFGLESYNPIVVGILCAGLGLISLILRRKYIIKDWRYWVLLIAALILFLHAVFTWSRTIYLGLGAVALIASVIYRSYSVAVLTVVGAFIVIGLFSIDGAGARVLDVGALSHASNRLPIWLNTVYDTLPVLFQGFGAGADVQFRGANDQLFEHPHSLYLQALVYSGLIGLMLYASVYFFAFYSVYKKWVQDSMLTRIGVLLLVYIAAVQLVEIHTFVSRPNMYWFLLWMPFGILVAAELSSIKQNEVQDIAIAGSAGRELT